MKKKCRAAAKSGKPCRAAAGENGLCFLHANPKMVAVLGSRGGKKNRRFPPTPNDTPLFVPETARDIAKLLAETMAEIRVQRLDPRIGSTLGYLASTLLKAIEVTDVAKRTDLLEDDGRMASSSEIVRGFARLANLHPSATRGGISGQIAALMALAKITGTMTEGNFVKDEFFRGWTEEELLHYATTGTIPARLTDGE